MTRKADIPGWALIVALIVGILGLIFLIWLAIRSGQAGVEVIEMIP
jgi:hypothetical protein